MRDNVVMGSEQKIQNHTAQVVLHCDDVSACVDYYTDELDFRLDTIYPADAPRVATLSGFGISVRLESGAAAGPRESGLPPNDPSLVVTQLDEAEFATGRAGMQYRDLIPGRYGGRFIASHIRIPDCGPVPDYVHYHDIRFQLIYCVNGWVRVVYEDQGSPMLLEAGDCFLQPPLIRHRVLECSDQLEVIEMTCPAEHETSVDHDMTLPTSDTKADRDFGGQRFVFHEAKNTAWTSWIAEGMHCRDTGIAGATGGVASAIAVRRSGKTTSVSLQHDAEIRFLYLVKGSAELLSKDGNPARLEAGSAVAIPPSLPCSLNVISPDFEMLEVMAPVHA